jgi:hypothetical protein
MTVSTIGAFASAAQTRIRLSTNANSVANLDMLHFAAHSYGCANDLMADHAWIHSWTLVSVRV